MNLSFVPKIEKAPQHNSEELGFAGCSVSRKEIIPAGIACSHIEQVQSFVIQIKQSRFFNGTTDQPLPYNLYLPC